MTETPFHRDNHFVPGVYLKRWTSASGRVWTYRTLVSHSKVPPWKSASIRGVAYQAYLYTRIVAGRESDDFEKWFEQEIETPAEEALEKATSNARLSPADWKHLIRFLAAQDVRTPARYAESIQRWDATLPTLIEETIHESVCTLELASRKTSEGQMLSLDPLPLRVITEIEAGQKFGKIRAEILAGRGLWLFEIRHLLTQTVNVLLQNRWTVLSPPEGVSWFTSDNPVIRLNYYGPGKYDFKGGWGNPRTDIFLPLSPRHVLYTQVGNRPPYRGEILPRDQAEMIRRFAAENAHRLIIAEEPDAEIPKLRPRTVDAEMFRKEREAWCNWHLDQTVAERELMDRDQKRGAPQPLARRFC